MSWEDLFYSSPLIIVTVFALVVLVFTIIDIRKGSKHPHSTKSVRS